MADGRPWPGWQLRSCPVCAQPVDTHRQPVEDERDEVVIYHQHWLNGRALCPMSGQRAAIRAVAFTTVAGVR